MARSRHAAADRRGGERACSSAARSRPPSCATRTSRRSRSATASSTASCAPSTRPRATACRSRSRTSSRRRASRRRRARRSSRATSPSSTRRSPSACKAAGLALLGKTNTDEFAMGSSTENSAYGPSRNPWDPARVPGGSGGGSAAAVTAGHGAVGARLRHRRLDQAAVRALRERRPAADLRQRLALRHRRLRVEPRPGRPGREDRPRRRAPLLDHRRPRPARLDDRRAARSRCGFPRTTRSTACGSGVPTELNEAEGIEPGVKDGGREGDRARARASGAEVGECSLPRSVRYGMPCYYLIAPAEASSNLARYDGVRYGPRADGDELPGARASGRATRASATSRSAGSCSGRTRSPPATTTRTTGRRRRCGRSSSGSIARRSSASTSSPAPTSPTVAFPIGERAADPLAMYASDLLTIPSCLAGLPGLSIPCGLSDGLPVGLQLIGPQFGENALFRVGHALERALGVRHRPGALAMSGWEPVVGLEMHVHLKTRSKMFCRCPVGFGARAEHADLPRLPRVPGRAAGREPEGDRVDDQARASRSAATSPSRRCSRARTTSIPTCRRAIRSHSTIYRFA